MSTEITLSPAQKLGIDEHIYSALKNSIYPGASDESVMMVVSYCKAAKLDPLLKPVHIVPMGVTDKTKPKNQDGYYPKIWRDIVMPGIGLYRIQASRTQKYAGKSKPVFGEDITQTFEYKNKKTTITYPKWCLIKAKRILEDGTVVEFVAKEFWIENYANKGSGDTTPNAMWEKRPYAQLAKCTEAQVLRQAFPELGSQPTAEEMEGKQLDNAMDDDIPKANPAEQLQKKLISNTEANTAPAENGSEKSLAQEIMGLSIKIHECKTKEELEALFPAINAIKVFAHKKDTMGIYKAKMDEFSVK